MLPINNQISSSSPIYRLLAISSTKANILSLKNTNKFRPLGLSSRILPSLIGRSTTLATSFSTSPLLKFTNTLRSYRNASLKRSRNVLNTPNTLNTLSANELVQTWFTLAASSSSTIRFSTLGKSSNSINTTTSTSTDSSKILDNKSSPSESSSTTNSNTTTSTTTTNNKNNILGWFQKNKQEMKFLFQTFGYFTVASYLGVYTVALSSIYGLVSTGIISGPDPTDWINNFWLKKLTMGDDLLILPSWSINFATAWVLTKLTEPIRLVTTIALVPYAAKRLPPSILYLFGVKPESLEKYRQTHPKRTTSNTIIKNTTNAKTTENTNTTIKK